MKVHELAKENGFTATKFMEEIRKFGVDKKHHMNVLSDEEVSLIRKKLQKGVQNNQNNGKTENLNKKEIKSNENIAKIVYGKNNTDKPIKIPSNLWIIATMNTSDQNVFTLDTAFQRRFTMRLIENSFKNAAKEFKELPILDTTITWENFCTTINSVITESGDNTSSMEDKRLGVYFLTENELKNKELFAYKVLKYLWDDVFKFDKGAFNSNFKTLEAIIVHFINDENSGDLQFDIFNDEIRAELAKNTK